jgi:hypothetical protein
VGVRPGENLGDGQRRCPGPRRRLSLALPLMSLVLEQNTRATRCCLGHRAPRKGGVAAGVALSWPPDMPR